MKERPILFSAPMVRAILDGSKTQTRRVVKPQPSSGDHFGFDDKQRLKIPTWDGVWLLPCPYGEPGDRLWVREAFLGWYKTADKSFSHVAAYRADGYELEAGERWTPSIHMPRSASRITLEITGVRVERLQDISEADAIAEGADPMPWVVDDPHRLIDWPLKERVSPHRNGYAQLWESINGPGSWDANPWVWVVEFKRVEGSGA